MREIGSELCALFRAVAQPECRSYRFVDVGNDGELIVWGRRGKLSWPLEDPLAAVITLELEVEGSTEWTIW
jgi:hypothetical protein